MENIQETIKPIAKFFYIVTHPKTVFVWLINMSYWIAVLVSITSLLFFIATNSKKSKRILSGTILAYILLKAIASVI